MLAGGKTTDQHPGRRRPKWLNLPTLGLIIAVGGVVAVPVVMQVKQVLIAEATWPGTVGASIYRQGHDYSKRVAAIERQDALGWTANVRIISPPRTSRLTTFDVELRDRAGRPIAATEATATLAHPLQESLDRGPLRAEILSLGQYRIQIQLPRGGKWRLQFAAVAADGTPFRRDFDIQVPDQVPNPVPDR
jgi:nitrogen fixation protein FixH